MADHRGVHVDRADLAPLLSLLGLPPREGLAATVDRVRELLDHIDTLTGLAYEDHWVERGRCTLCDEPDPCHERLLIDRVRAAVRGEATDTEEAGRAD